MREVDGGEGGGRRRGGRLETKNWWDRKKDSKSGRWEIGAGVGKRVPPFHPSQINMI